MLIFPKYDETGRVISLVMEEKNEYFVRRRPLELIQDSCSYYGDSLKGRQDAATKLCGYTHKIPVSINPLTGIFFLPTISPSNEKCTWLSHTHILKILEYQEYQSKVLFNNGKTIILDVSHGSLQHQVYRTAQYRFLLETRIRQSLIQQTNIINDLMFNIFQSLINSQIKL